MPRRHRTLELIGPVSALVLAATAARADAATADATADDTNSATAVSQVVVTASRQDLLGKAVTASQGSVTAEELQLRPAYRVGQLLETVPGLVVTVHSGEGKAYQYLLRGFNLDHGTDIANFVDDVPVNRPTNAHGQGYSDLNFVIPEVLAGVDYTKGTYYPSVGDFGDVASEHMRLADTIPDQMSVSAGTLGDENLFLGGSRDLGADSHILGGLEVGHVDGPFHPGNDFRKYAGIVRLSQAADTHTDDLTVMYYQGDGNFTTDQPERAIQEGLIGRFGTLDPTDGNSSERLSVSGHYAAQAGAWRLATNAYYVHSRQTLWNNFTHFLEDPVNGDQEEQDETRDLAGGGASAMLKSSFGAIASETTFGAQGRYDDVFVDRRHTLRRHPLDYCELLGPDGVTATRIDVGQTFCTRDRVHLGDAGLYVENRTHWTGWLRTDVGLREEIYGGDDRSLMPGAAFSRTPFRQTQTLLQPKGSLVIGPWRNTELYLSAGRGFHSDDLRGVSGTVPLEGLGGTRTAPLLVKADGEEIGLRSDPLPNLHVQLAAFNVRLESEIVYDQDQGEDQPGPPSDRYGVEVSAEYRPAPWLELNTDLALSHARFIGVSAGQLANEFGQAGNHIDLAPSFIGSVGAIVDNLGPWYGGLQVRMLGPYPLISENSERDVGYTETNASVGYRFSRRLKGELEIFNLFNVKANSAAFFYTTDIHDGLGPVANRQVHPLEPISARLSLTADL